MRSKILFAFIALFSINFLHAQGSLEQRVDTLEKQVRELRLLHNLQASATEAHNPLSGNGNVKFGYPGGKGTLLVKDYYVILHDDVNKEPEWVTYHLTKEDLTGTAARTDDFRADPALPAGRRAELADYKNSGFDRGHMASAADFKRSDVAISETFLLSNMCPQRPNLNRIMWEKLEEEVRALAGAHGSIWIFSGPLYLDGSGKPAHPQKFIGPDSVAVPTHFFKVILCEHPSGTHEMFAFIMENKITPLTGAPKDYIVSVDSVESVSGLDFFSALPDSEENRLESEVQTNGPIH